MPTSIPTQKFERRRLIGRGGGFVCGGQRPDLHSITAPAHRERTAADTHQHHNIFDS